MSPQRGLFRIALFGCAGSLVLASGCKTRNFGSQAKTDESGMVDPYSTDPCKDTESRKRFRGKLPLFVLRSLGKIEDVQLNSAALRNKETPWVDWQYLWGVDGKKFDDDTFAKLAKSSNPFLEGIANAANTVQGLRQQPGQLAALISLQLQRTELLKCNMFDTNGGIDDYTPGDINANTASQWASLQFANRVQDLPEIATKKDASGALVARGPCSGPEEQFRTLDGTCNDLKNPLMGAKLTRFGRNVSFDAARKYDDQPDPKRIAAELMYRSTAAAPGSRAEREENQTYRKAPFLNLIAASWIQFMTHDWFSHARKGKNNPSQTIKVGDSTVPATLQDTSKQAVSPRGKFQGPRSGTFQNQVTFWWDASQIYGSDELTAERVRDPKDRSKLRLDANQMLPLMRDALEKDSTAAQNELNEHELGQGLAAFPDNWWMGMALLHTAFAREHNRYVAELKRVEKITDDERAFQLGRLYISALIAKIHTIEWTPQLLFNPVLESGMEANWHGLVGNRAKDPSSQRVADLRDALGRAINKFNSAPAESSENVASEDPFIAGALQLKDTKNPMQRNFLFAFLASVPGATSLNSNHFGAPFTLPEEFTSVYRLHPLIPDVLEKRVIRDGRIMSVKKGFTPVRTVDTALELATGLLTNQTIGDWWLSFGSQKSGTLQLNNYPRFMKSLKVRQNPQGQQDIDLAALEIARDRERGVPKLNEFRANIGLTPLRDFDDFIDMELAYRVFKACLNPSIKQYSEFKDSLGTAQATGVMDSCTKPELAADKKARLEADKAALKVQLAERDKLQNLYGDVNRVDTLVGFLAENTRPHGFALAETQFQIFILNASRRLFSDRFFSTSYNAETYTKYGIEQLRKRGMRDVLADNFTEGGLDKLLRDKTTGKFRIANAFDPWTRERNGYELTDSYKLDTLHGGLFQ
jgi:hypothetical protein